MKHAQIGVRSWARPSAPAERICLLDLQDIILVDGQCVHGTVTDLINIKCVSIVKLFCRRRAEIPAVESRKQWQQDLNLFVYFVFFSFIFYYKISFYYFIFLFPPFWRLCNFPTHWTQQPPFSSTAWHGVYAIFEWIFIWGDIYSNYESTVWRQTLYFVLKVKSQV